MIRDKQEFEVELIVTTRHLIRTYSYTPEEAEADAETLYLDGDTGVILSTDIEQTDAYPTEPELDADNDDSE